MKNILILTATLLMLTACAPDTSGVMTDSAGEQRIDNSFFASNVAVSQPVVNNKGGLLKGTGTIKNKISTDVHLQYKFTWFDANKVAVDADGMSWKSITVHGHQEIQVMSVAANSSAIRCQLYVRKINN